MAWVKLDDGIFNNRKVIAVSKDAKLMYIAGICFCSSTLSDGVIPAKTVSVIAAQCEIKSPARMVKELVAEGLWIESDGGYLVHDYLEHNESSHDVRAKQEAARERMQRARSQNVRANKTRTSREVHEPDTDIDTDTELTKTPDGVLEAQAPATPPAHAEPPDPKPKRAAQIPADWQPSDGLRTWAIAEGFAEQDIEQQIPQFVDHWRAKGEPRKDWEASFRTWMRNAKRFGHTFAQPPRSPARNDEYLNPTDLLKRAAELRERDERLRTSGDSGGADDHVPDQAGSRSRLSARAG